jgi:hypothetical protein
MTEARQAPAFFPVALTARIEPWLFVLAILGILFLPPKGSFWLLLLGAAALRTLRLWFAKWESYRADTAGRFLSSFLTIPLIILLYFGFARVLPGLVYQHPEQQSIESFELASAYQLRGEGAQAFAAELRLARDPQVARSYRVTATRLDPSGMPLGQFSAYLRERDITTSKLGGFRLPVTLQKLRGSFLPGQEASPMGEEMFRAMMSFDEAGEPRRLQILSQGRTIYSAQILARS